MIRSIIPLAVWMLCHYSLLAQTTKTELINVCDFGDNPKNEYALDYQEDLERIIQRMISTTGFRGDYIYIDSSPDVSYAATGLRRDKKAEIVVASGFTQSGQRWYQAVILAHELAHIFNRDIYGQNPDLIDNELKADYFAGFWAGKNGNDTLIEYIKLPYYDVPEDPHHPPREERLKSLQTGWDHARKPFSFDDIGKDSAGAKYSSVYGKCLNMYFTISPDRRFKNTPKYRVYFHLASNSLGVPLTAIIKNISRVSYVLHAPTFKRPFVTSCNCNNDDFGYTMTGVYGTFPIVCLVYFKDESVWSTIKEFPLPSKEPKN